MIFVHRAISHVGAAARADAVPSVTRGMRSISDALVDTRNLSGGMSGFRDDSFRQRSRTLLAKTGLAVG
jgi:hypothetical protein